MAPSFSNLAAEDPDFDSDEEIDFSDLRAQHEVRMEQGLDTFVLVDGLPVVPEDSKPKLIKFLLKKLQAAGKTSEDAIYMPMNDKGMSEGYAFVEYNTPESAGAAIKQLHGTALDKKHTIAVNKISDIERYGREGKVEERYHEPPVADFQEKQHLRWWLADPSARDQFVMYRGETVGVYWNRRKEVPENVVDRLGWTGTGVAWSPLGTYLATMHPQGVQTWGTQEWSRQNRFPHPRADLFDFSPNEKYICTWSFKPIEVEENDPILSLDEEGKNYIIWEVDTGKVLRSFATHDLGGPTVDEQGNPIRRRIPWPAFKWSADDKYVARMKEGESISIYELPRMNLLDKSTIKVDGIRDFEWSPATPQREGVKNYEQLFCYWTPEIGSAPARVGLMSIPSKEIVRTRNVFNVTDARLHWQSDGKYVCIKMDRQSKSKKPMSTSLEIFRIREKGVPVEVVDSIKDHVINFAFEPKGDRFVFITTNEPVQQTAVPPKTSVSFFAPEKTKSHGVASFKHVRTIDKKNSNGIYWSPKGRHCAVGTIGSQVSFDIDFWDLDYEGDKPESEKDVTANLQLMATAEHYCMTDIIWDPTGRYVISYGSIFRQQIEHGYHVYDFKGELLREEHIDKLKQILWRPRPVTLLSKDQQKQIRRNLREYSKDFEEEDRIADDKEKGAVVEHRRQMLSEWLAWRRQAIEELQDDRVDMGLPADPEEAEAQDDEPEKVVEEMVEEIIDETEEIIS